MAVFRGWPLCWYTVLCQLLAVVPPNVNVNQRTRKRERRIDILAAFSRKPKILHSLWRNLVRAYSRYANYRNIIYIQTIIPLNLINVPNYLRKSRALRSVSKQFDDCFPNIRRVQPNCILRNKFYCNLKWNQKERCIMWGKFWHSVGSSK